MATVNDKPLRLNHDLTRRQIDLLLQGGVVNWLRERLGADRNHRRRSLERRPIERE
jgi:hypothetical protein